MISALIVLSVGSGCIGVTARHAPEVVVSDSSAVSVVLRHVAETRNLPVHGDPRPLTPSFDPFIMMNPGYVLSEDVLESVDPGVTEVRRSAIVAVGAAVADAIGDFACAWGDLMPHDKAYFEIRRQRGCDAITPHMTVIMTRPQTEIRADAPFEDDDLATQTLEKGRGVVVRALIIGVSPDGGNTSTEDFVIGMDADGYPEILTTRGLLATD